MPGPERGGRGAPAFSRLLAATLLMDGSFYLILTVVPLRAAEMGASAFQLGILPVLASGVYVLSALVFGRLSDRLPRMLLARTGAWIRVGAAVGLTGAGTVPALMAWMPALGIANGLFWPALQASIGDLRPEGDLRRSLGGFNISWSTGKMLGFLAGGLVIAAAGYRPALLLAAGLTGVTALVLPGSALRDRLEPPADAQSDPSDIARRKAWRRVGWMANFVLFGVGATLNYHYPKLLVSLGFSGADFGVYLGAVYFFQTACFILLRRWSGWHFRLGPLLAAQGLALVSVGVLGFLRTRALIWATAPGIGLGLGVSYSSSIFYSLFRESGRGRNTGIHEALLGTGTFLLPFLGGAAASATGSLLAPYLVAASALAGTMAVEWALVGEAGRVVARGGL